jgi:hypothetical protein
LGGPADFLLAFDIIDMIDEIIGDVRAGGSWHKFMVPRDAGVTGWEVEQLLVRHGVKIWGRGFTSNAMYFSCKGKQANWAEYLIRRKGIPLSCAPVNPRNDEYAKKYSPGSEPPGWRDKPRRHRGKQSWLDSLAAWLSGG